MEQVSLLSRARRAQRQALDEKSHHTQQCITAELAEAGPNPVVTDPIVLEKCLLYLETRIMESATAGRGEVVILYTDVPAMQERMTKTRELRHIQDLDKVSMIKTVGDAFVARHGYEILFHYQYMSNSFRICWH